MAWSSLLSVFLCFLVFFHGCNAGGRQQNQCNLERLTAADPNRGFQSEAGVTEFWDENNEQFRCAGVAAYRRIIQPRGLLLPSYTNAPQLAYVVQGRGFQGTVFPRCAETFQSSQDQHQKIRSVREGDVIAIPAGSAYWAYNDGNSSLVVVGILDIANTANQLDLNPRRFFLAGNPKRENEQQRPSRRGSNIFSGFDSRLLAETFRVDEEIARSLQGENDRRGAIVRADGLEVLRPASSPEQRGDGFDETFCAMSTGENIDDPLHIDFYNPRAGRLSILNSLTLPILKSLQLSAEKGVLNGGAMFAPHWSLNAHSIVYLTRGEGLCQIVDNLGQAVFEGELRQGQVLVVPQGFVMVTQAGSQGFEWVAFKTNENSVFSTLAGRASTMRGLPLDVIANAYRISRNEAQELKFGRDETVIFAPFRASA